MVWFGSTGGPIAGDMGGALQENFMKRLDLRSFHPGSTANADPGLVYPALMTLLEHLAGGRIDLHIHAELPLDRAWEAYEMLERGKVMGKLLLKTWKYFF